jgi:hypothetical protein
MSNRVTTLNDGSIVEMNEDGLVVLTYCNEEHVPFIKEAIQTCKLEDILQVAEGGPEDPPDAFKHKNYHVLYKVEQPERRNLSDFWNVYYRLLEKSRNPYNGKYIWWSIGVTQFISVEESHQVWIISENYTENGECCWEKLDHGDAWVCNIKKILDPEVNIMPNATREHKIYDNLEELQKDYPQIEFE